VGGPFLTVAAKLRMASSSDSWGRGPKIDLPPLGGVRTGDGRPARLELGAGGLLSAAGGRLLLAAAPRLLGGLAELGGVRLLGGRAFEAPFAARVVAVGLLAGARAAAVNAGRLGARAGFRLLGGRWVAAAWSFGGRCAEPRLLLAGRCVLAPRLLGGC
jgi:hypothetical protein